MMTLDSLPAPFFDVELINKGNAHYYKDKGEDHVYRGVTGTLDLISKGGLGPWMKKTALLNAKSAMLRNPFTKPATRGFNHYQDWVDDIIEEASKAPDKVKDKAADHGTKAHGFIDDIINGRKPKDIPDDIRPSVLSFEEWFRKSGITIIAGDTKVLSKLYKYGGSLDALGTKDNKYVILDWKTGKNIYTTHQLQLGAYAHALNETYGIWPDYGYIVRFGKGEVEHEAHYVESLDVPFKAFLCCLDLQQLIKKLEKGEN